MNKLKSSFLQLSFSLFTTSLVFAGDHKYDVTSFGAKNDSSAICTKAISNAIAKAAKAGGGTIYFPAGKYLTGPIHLKSNITIEIDAGAELHFSDNFDDYLPFVESRYEGVDVYSFSPLFYAYKAENISIKGRGLVNGHGKKWWDFVLSRESKSISHKYHALFDSLNKNILLPDDPRQMKNGFLRPPFIQPLYCKNVLVEGITIINSPFWTVTPEFCENVTIHGVTINNPHSPNTDGINPSSCSYVHISDCHISVGDDCITIKSGKDIPGRTKATPAQNYTITNCTMLSGHGGVVIGSEMSGDVKKITISNCIFDGTDRGIRIKTARGRGGIVEDIRVDNIVMKNIKLQAIVLDMEYAKVPPEAVSERTPQFRNIHLSDITAQTKEAIYINGLEEMPVDNISFSNLQFDAQTGINIRNANNIAFHDVTVTTKTGPALKANNVTMLEVDNVKSLKPIAGVPTINFENIRNAFVHNCWPVASNDPFIQIKGSKTDAVTIKNNNFVQTPNAVAKDADVKGNVQID